MVTSWLGLIECLRRLGAIANLSAAFDLLARAYHDELAARAISQNTILSIHK